MGREPRWTCPYGRPGDRLWVRETWSQLYPYESRRVAYRADRETVVAPGVLPWWRPSIHMPRWASRLTLEITKVRVERLKEITVKDIAAEGIQEGVGVFAYEDFRKLWDSLNAKRGFGWDANPWVWVVEFRLVTGRQR
jgi:hypothetical protein